MNAASIISTPVKSTLLRAVSKSCRAAVLVVLVGISCNLARGQAEPADSDVAGAEVLTRGPVHEAFAGMVTFNPEPGVVVSKAPPEVIEEVPPDERPEGDNVAWIPGYWAWDDERSDFLWVSGTWRALPPGREWIAGYWSATAQGQQWISGYWADAGARETTYLPPPPATVEVGPNIAAPSEDYGWSPGCWVWHQERYAWRPGYWALGRADWDWMPAHYVWTPRGYIFVGGYWDYTVERRGILFAPVYFESGVYSRRGYHYSPRIVISVSVFHDHLFLRPRYSHYYFGDYYAPSYHQGGFYASFSFQSSRHGYDPFYSHQRWEHRRDREWEHRVEASYQNRRDHETARPPRTWAAQKNIRPDTADSKENRMPVAAPIDQIAKRKDGPMRFQPVAKEERQKLTQRGQEVQKSREQRRTLEAGAVNTAVRKPGEVVKPTKAELPRSPIVARPVNQLGGNLAPPKAQQSPKPDPKFQPKPVAPGRPPTVDQPAPPTQPRKAEPEKKTKPGKGEAVPRARPVQPEPSPRTKEPRAQVPEQLPRLTTDAEKPAKLEAQPQSERRAQDAALKAQQDSQRNTRALEPRAQAPAVKAPRVSEQPARLRPDPHEKGATKLMRNNRQNDGNGRSSPSEKKREP